MSPVSLHPISHPSLCRALLEHAQELEHRLLAMQSRIKHLEQELASARAASATKSLERYCLHPHQYSSGMNGAGGLVGLNELDWDVSRANGEVLPHPPTFPEMGQMYSEESHIMVCSPRRTPVPVTLMGLRLPPATGLRPTSSLHLDDVRTWGSWRNPDELHAPVDDTQQSAALPSWVPVLASDVMQWSVKIISALFFHSGVRRGVAVPLGSARCLYNQYMNTP